MRAPDPLVCNPPPPRSPVLARWLLVLATVLTVCTAAAGVVAAQPAPTPATPAPPTATTPQPGPAAPNPAPGAPVRPATPPAQPTPAPATPGDPAGGGTGSEGGEPECGVTHIRGCVQAAIDGFFQRLVDSAINPLLDLLSEHLLTTPDPATLPRIGELWSQSWQLVLTTYGLLVVAAGIVLMTREVLQTRWGVRDLAPRLVVGFGAGAMSMLIATQAIRLANALATALAGGNLETNSASTALREMARSAGFQGIFATLLRTVLVIALVVLLVGYVVRVAITVVLLAGAPLALMCHALPATEAVARWWWRGFGACLAIQVVQSLVLITATKVFLSPGGWGFFGPNRAGLVNLIVGLALVGILIKVPFWLLSTLRIGHGGSFVGTVARGYVLYKTFGLVRATEKGLSGALHPRPVPTPVPKPQPDPYEKVAATRSGQLLLPLAGVKRLPPKSESPQRIPHAASLPVATAPQGEQLMLPLPQFHNLDLGPVPPVGRDGQYRLPISVQRVSKGSRSAPAPPPRPAPAPSGSSTVRVPPRRGRQLAFDYDAPEPDPYAKVRPRRDGQYPLPIEVRRVPRLTNTPPPPPPNRSTPPPRTGAPVPPPSSPPRPVGRQLHLPLPDLPVRRRHRPSSGDSK